MVAFKPDWGTAGVNPAWTLRLGEGAAGSAPVGQSQRPVSGTSSIRGGDRRPTEPDAGAVVDNAPGVQLAAILALDSYGPVIDGHWVGG